MPGSIGRHPAGSSRVMSTQAEEWPPRLSWGEELPGEPQVEALIRRATQLLQARATLVRLSVPAGCRLHVVGDIHGQLAELRHVLGLCGPPVADQNLLLFNGDFVDRGHRSVEVMLTLLTLLVAHPGSIFLNRGNHETRAMNLAYGFYNEVVFKYSRRIFDMFQVLFAQLPLATLVNGSVLVVHGGLPARDGVRLADIAELPRGMVDLHSGLAHELLWADPMPRPGRQLSQRGGEIQLFGPDVSERFCKDNGLLCFIRSHEVAMRGYAWQKGGRCLTVFSAANYVGQVGNLGAVCHIQPSVIGRVAREDLSFSLFRSYREEVVDVNEVVQDPENDPIPRSRL